MREKNTEYRGRGFTEDGGMKTKKKEQNTNEKGQCWQKR